MEKQLVLFSIKTHLNGLTGNNSAGGEEDVIDGHDLSRVKHLHGLIQKPEQTERHEQIPRSTVRDQRVFSEGSDALDLEAARDDHDDEHDVEDGIGELQVTSTDRLRDHS